MGLIPVGAIFKGFTFDGEDSKDYGVYISGEAVFNAPERAVDMVEIPGRSGAYALDLGRFENIEVKYPAGIAADNETDFASGISALRNFLASRRGYCRLEDEYNPDEYRLAVYKSGLEVTPAQLKAGEFEIVFDCMPQRFLKSGETAVSVASGGTITNPTMYDASPLLKITGYGDFGINGVKDMSIQSPGTIGYVKVTEQTPAPTPNVIQYASLDTTQYNVGDKIKMSMNGEQIIGSMSYMPNDDDDIQDIQFELVSYSSSAQTPYLSADGLSFGGIYPMFTTGTSRTRNNTITTKVSYTLNGTPTSENFTSSLDIVYDGNVSISITLTPGVPSDFTLVGGGTVTAPQVLYVRSSKASPNDIYIDLDIGEAYKISGDVVIPANDQAYIPAQLPTLVPGANTITFDNTITQFKVVPRWWRV